MHRVYQEVLKYRKFLFLNGKEETLMLPWWLPFTCYFKSWSLERIDWVLSCTFQSWLSYSTCYLEQFLLCRTSKLLFAHIFFVITILMKWQKMDCFGWHGMDILVKFVFVSLCPLSTVPLIISKIFKEIAGTVLLLPISTCVWLQTSMAVWWWLQPSKTTSTHGGCIDQHN